MTVAGEERRCARGKVCAESVKAEGETRLVGALLTSPEGLCPACVGRLERTVRQLLDDVATLDELIGEFGPLFGPQVQHTPELRINIRPGIEALRAEIEFELLYWAETLDMETPVACRLGARVARAVEWIGPRIDALLRLGAQERTAWTPEGEPLRDTWGDREIVERTGLDGALKLFSLHYRVRQVAGRTALVHRLTPRCPYCDQPALVRHNGCDQVECENPDCAKKIKERHYEWFVEVTIREEQRRKAAAQVA